MLTRCKYSEVEGLIHIHYCKHTSYWRLATSAKVDEKENADVGRSARGSLQASIRTIDLQTLLRGRRRPLLFRE